MICKAICNVRTYMHICYIHVHTLGLFAVAWDVPAGVVLGTRGFCKKDVARLSDSLKSFLQNRKVALLELQIQTKQNKLATPTWPAQEQGNSSIFSSCFHRHRTCQAASTMRQMLAALKCCHDHYMGHFDVKPELLGKKKCQLTDRIGFNVMRFFLARLTFWVFY